MDLTRFPRRRYTDGATPLHAAPRFSAAIARDGGGPNVFIKRDDMLGLTPGGNKTRKLEFLVADALRQGCDTLITCGAVQSNHLPPDAGGRDPRRPALSRAVPSHRRLAGRLRGRAGAPRRGTRRALAPGR
jgi:hypothetical protein